MKTKLLMLIVLIAVPTILPAQNYQRIPLETAKEIADRNAQALWGDVYPAEPIPYYGFDDEIVAWRMNYSIGKPFPEKEHLIDQCRQKNQENEIYLQWGGDDYGEILMGARDNLPVMIEYSQSLSAEYAAGFELEKMVQKKAAGKTVKAGKIYYLNHSNTWHEYEIAGGRFYFCTSPMGGMLSEKAFLEKKNAAEHFIKPQDFSKQWEDYKAGKMASAKSDVYINNPELMPFYDWSYGCSPTAAAMLFAWYDNRSAITSYKYSYLITHHFMRYDTLNNEGRISHWDYNVPWLQRQLAIGMDTDTLTGSTMPWDIDDGMEWAANTVLDYDFDVVNRYSSKWTRLKDDVNEGKPLLAHISGHSTTAIGYNESTEKVITHYTHHPPNHKKWINKSAVLMITRVTRGGQRGASVHIKSPYGDPRYNNSGLGEIFHIGNYGEILWNADDVPGSTIDLSYSLNGGHHFIPIVSGTENDGMYDWLVDSDSVTNRGRVMINMYTPDMGNRVAGADGSWGNFRIKDEGAIAPMANAAVYQAEHYTRYYLNEHTEPSWAVIACRSLISGSHYEIQLFEDNAFNQEPMLTSLYGNRTNLIVIDGNHAPAVTRGVKLRPGGIPDTCLIQYEGGNDVLTLTPGTSYTINWPAGRIAKMYDIHLTPGEYFFKAENTDGPADVDMALFSSTDGNYFKTIHQAEYISENFGSTDDSFIATITQEGNYGLVLFAKYQGLSTIKLKIEDAFVWTGAEDQNWHNPNNWSGGVVPGPANDVVVSARPNYPIISQADAQCKKLTILQGGYVRITNHHLNISGDLFLNGKLYIHHASGIVNCQGDVEIADQANMDFFTGSKMLVQGNWTFLEGSDLHLVNGTVQFTGTGNSLLYVKSEDSWFHNLRISKTGGAWVAYDNCPGMQPLRVKNQFIIDNGAGFIQWAMHNSIFSGPFLAYAGSSFSFANGTAIFDRQGSGGININSEPGSYFNNVEVDVEDWMGLASDIEIRGDLSITGGLFKTNGHDMYLKGDFSQNAGFSHDNATVVFNGTANQSVNGVNFWRLELNKPGGELRFPVNETNVQHYNWEQGAIRVNGGEAYFWDLDDNGIYGNYIVTSGKLSLRQDPGSWVNLQGHINVSGGEMIVTGGASHSYWPMSTDASVTVSGGILDFKDNGIWLREATTSFYTNISGGLIRTNGTFRAARTDFHPSGGTLELYGAENDIFFMVHPSSHVNNLLITKGTGKEKGIVKTVYAFTNIHINGDFILEAGIFAAPEELYVAGDFINMKSQNNFVHYDGHVTFNGDSNITLATDALFYDLTIDKTGSGGVSVNDGITITAENSLLVDKGIFELNPGCTLLLDGAYESNYGGIMRLMGSETDPVQVGSASKGNYAFQTTGGSIEAVYTIFENMDADGVNIGSGTYVPQENAFHNCTFMNGAAGGTLVTWNNGADMVIQNAHFPENTTGSAYNVRKTTNYGNVYFQDATGPFSGEAFEDDPYQRIDWEYKPPHIIPFDENWSSASFSTQLWVPEGDNWVISETSGNPPPAAEFRFTPRIFNYSVPLRSHLLDGTNFENINVKYDIRYDHYSPATIEQFKVDAVRKNGDFITLANYNSAGGSFGFITEQFNISDFADGEIFYLRFTAFGEDSWNIDAWLVDNISVTGQLPAPAKITGFVKDTDGIKLQNALIEIVGTAYTTMSQEDGSYTLFVPPGIYDARASLEGYFPETVEDIVFVSGETVVVDFFLEPVPPSYCTENLYTTGCIEGDGLTHFEISDLVNAESGCSPGGYGDFTEMSTALARGYAYEVTLMSGYSDQYVSLWIDFDDDFDFSESERLLTNFHLEFPDLAYQATIMIPADAPEGAHRLRVRTNWNSASHNPCATYQYGEAEDYTVVITNEELTASLYASIFSAATGDPIEHAEISILGTAITGMTGDEGICLIEWIGPGSYDIEISAFGHETATVSEMYLFGGEICNLEVYLEEAPLNTHEITVSPGWSGLSSYVVPANNALEEVFAAFLYDLIIVQNFSGVFWPQEELNTIGDWEHHSAYAVKTGNGFTLPVTGYQENNPVFLLDEGWTMLPVICNHNPNTGELFLPVVSDLLLVKEIAGTGIYWPAMGINTLPELQLGKAYLVKMQSAATVTFPENMTKTESLVNLKNPFSCELWENPVPTANSHIIAIPQAVWTTGGFSDGDVVGVFTTGGICAGLAQLTGNTSIAVFQDDPLVDEKQGFEAGEAMHFRIYKPSTGEVMDIEIGFDPAFHDGKFDAMGISVATGIKTTAASVSGNEKAAPVVYPNPTTGIIQIAGIQANAHISIHNSQGKKILEQGNYQEKAVLDLSANPPGVYLLRITHAAGVFNRKIIVY
jgi:hypothetical protein